MSMSRHAIGACAVALAACNQEPAQESQGSAPPPDEPAISAPAQLTLPPVDPALLEAPNSAFTAIEPTELGVAAAPDVMQALEPLLGPEVVEGSTVHLTVRETGDDAIADIVRTGLQDDSVSGGHVRIEFRREADGWYPTNAFRRTQCGRGAEAGQWTTELCP